MIDGHVDPDAIYIVFDLDQASSVPVYGVFTSMDKALEACEKIAEDLVKECLAVDPEESGIETKEDIENVKQECLCSLGIQIINEGINEIRWASELRTPYTI